MSKFVGGLITGSVLTLVGLGIAAAISDGTLSNPFDDMDLPFSDKNKDEEEKVEEEGEGEEGIKEEESPIGKHCVEGSEKLGSIFGKGVGEILNAVEAGVESFSEALSEELDDSADNNSSDDDE